MGGTQGLVVVGVLQVPQTDPQQCSLGGHWAVRYRYHSDRKTWVSCCGTHGPANSNPTSPVHPCCRDAVLLVQSCISCVRIWDRRPRGVRGKSSQRQGVIARTTFQKDATVQHGRNRHLGGTATRDELPQWQARTRDSADPPDLWQRQPCLDPSQSGCLKPPATGRQSIHGKAWTPAKTQVAVLTIARPKSGHGLHVIRPGHSRLLVSARRLGLGRRPAMYPGM